MSSGRADELFLGWLNKGLATVQSLGSVAALSDETPIAYRL